MDVVVPARGVGERDSGALSGGRQRSSGAGRADGGDVGAAGGRDAAGAPRFDQPVPPGGYLWWYVDALSDDGRHGLTIIVFVGSVFSPYYGWATRRGRADAENHCAFNVALYGAAGKRWTMTERSRASVARSAREYVVGPSRIAWEGDHLVLDIDEIAVPLPQRVRGRVRLHPEALSTFSAPLDDAGRHRWGPIAPCARVEVALQRPEVRWSGHAYLDSNEGDEPIVRAFAEWDWSRASLRDGSTAVLYDVRQKEGADRLLALRFARSGGVDTFAAPPRQPLPRTLWRIDRTLRTDPGAPAKVMQTLEDTPFYVRSVLESGLLGERVTSMHETLNVPRLASAAVQLMLPWRMPRTR
jgi:carotenoid 1,2-hydratase